jgi:hypothetical protein
MRGTVKQGGEKQPAHIPLGNPAAGPVGVMPVFAVAVPLSGFSEWPHLALQLFVMRSRYIRIVSPER